MTAHSAPERGDRGDRTGGDKRERILAAAERIFARHGFFAARVSEVAKEAEGRCPVSNAYRGSMQITVDAKVA